MRPAAAPDPITILGVSFLSPWKIVLDCFTQAIATFSFKLYQSHILLVCFYLLIGKRTRTWIANYPTFLDLSTFRIISREAKPAQAEMVVAALPRGSATASCADNSACVPSRLTACPRRRPRSPNPTRRFTLFRDRTKEYVQHVTLQCGSWCLKMDSKSNGARGAKTFDRGRALVKRDWPPSAFAVDTVSVKSMRRNAAIRARRKTTIFWRRRG